MNARPWTCISIFGLMWFLSGLLSGLNGQVSNGPLTYLVSLASFSPFVSQASGSLIADDLVPDDQPTAEQIKFFEAKIRPVLVKECYSCHSNQVGQVKGGLWVDSRDSLLSGGDSGPAIVPGSLEESVLWNALNHLDYAMPPRRKLSDEILHDFRQWIEMGAPDPRETAEQNIRSAITAEDIEQGREFWSFKRPQLPAVPTNENHGWAKTAIDQFVLAKWNELGLPPPADAEPRTLLRRLYFDLIGLPPSPKEVENFVTDWEQDSDSALEQTVDWLLAQPQFGERWGRHWLDVARYAESSGRELNLTYPQAWRYRDFVIDSFNDDKPYNEFVIQQLAGDLLPVDSDEAWAENLVATGFLALGPKGLREQNRRQFELDLVDEQLDATTRVMLGLSVACARCHDHKFEPIPQTDYYALAGIFSGMSTHFGTSGSLQNRRSSNLIVLPIEDLNPQDQPVSKKQLAAMKTELAQTQVELRDAVRARATRPNDPNGRSLVTQIPQLNAKISALESLIHSVDSVGNPLTMCMAVQETQPVNLRLLERGELSKPAQAVPRGFPQVLCSDPPAIGPQSTGRLEFAQWVGSDNNPLTARVLVNRIWQHLFVHGIVRTPDDFGATGETPTHPELLDYLTLSFIENNWSIKQQIRQIVLSRSYRVDSQFRETSFMIDPENKYLWRMEPRRLQAEAIRDAMLTLSGRLDRERPRASIVAAIGNAQVNNGQVLAARTALDPMALQSSGMSSSMASETTPASRPEMGPEAARGRLPRFISLDQDVNYRSVYLPVARDNILRGMEVFDFAESSLVISQREISHTPDQGLYYLNNSFVIKQADEMARGLMRQSDNLNQQLKLAFQWAYGRPATNAELRAAQKFYRDLKITTANFPSNSAGQNFPGLQRLQNARNRNRPDPFRPNPSRPDVSRDRETANQRPEIDRLKLSAVCQAIMASAEFRIVN